MAGTGRHGYTGYTSTGDYVQNGIIQSSGTASGNDYLSNLQSIANNAASNVSSAANNVVQNSQLNSLAANMAGIAGTGDSDYSEYLRQALEISANNTALSQQMAREQMDYQRQSDQTAMAWSANEASKNREWQERLSNTAHQREVQDLLKAGLNPILSANNGAYTGSGATGQGFSSSGAMGSVDTSVNGLVGQLISTYINTASQAAVAGMYTDATRYQADMQYAMNKANIDANLLMQDKSISSNEKMNRLNSDIALSNANTAAGASLGAASMTAGATVEASLNNMTAAIIGHFLGNEGTHYTADVGANNNARTNNTNERINQAQIASNEKQAYMKLYGDMYKNPYTTAKDTLNRTFGGESSIEGAIDAAIKAWEKTQSKSGGKARKF